MTSPVLIYPVRHGTFKLEIHVGSVILFCVVIFAITITIINVTDNN